jgi:hypothetical protein
MPAHYGILRREPARQVFETFFLRFFEGVFYCGKIGGLGRLQNSYLLSEKGAVPF